MKKTLIKSFLKDFNKKALRLKSAFKDFTKIQVGVRVEDKYRTAWFNSTPSFKKYGWLLTYVILRTGLISPEAELH
tara:strand:- start:54 stop:281 length:228 start_codon:yes stop_codon:yes gene_type:complete